jgi:hypothetical protein
MAISWIASDRIARPGLVIKACQGPWVEHAVLLPVAALFPVEQDAPSLL